MLPQHETRCFQTRILHSMHFLTSLNVWNLHKTDWSKANKMVAVSIVQMITKQHVPMQAQKPQHGWEL